MAQPSGSKLGAHGFSAAMRREPKAISDQRGRARLGFDFASGYLVGLRPALHVLCAKREHGVESCRCAYVTSVAAVHYDTL